MMTSKNDDRRPPARNVEAIVAAAQALLSDIEAMDQSRRFEGEPWYGDFDSAPSDDGSLILWPNLAISAGALRAALDARNEAAPATQYWLVEVWGDVEPYLHGPYATEQAMDDAARAMRQKQIEDDGEEYGIYPLVIENGKPRIDAYSGGFFGPKP